MKYYQIGFCILAVGCAVSLAAVLQYEPLKGSLKTNLNDLMELIAKPRTPSRYIPDFVYKELGLNPSTKVSTYNWKNCGNESAENLIIRNMTLSPDPISLPGTISVSFEIVLKIDFESPLAAEIVLEKQLGPTWIKIPCIGQIGSCTYTDICIFATGYDCPPQFVTAKIPCKCPFQQGTYKLPKASFELDFSFLPSGDYRIHAVMSHKNMFGGCYDIEFSIE